jgi:hypothetical protein
VLDELPPELDARVRLAVDETEELIEDLADIRESAKRLADPDNEIRIPWEEIKSRYDLSSS